MVYTILIGEEDEDETYGKTDDLLGREMRPREMDRGEAWYEAVSVWEWC